jgi:hypothetical protein
MTWVDRHEREYEFVLERFARAVSISRRHYVDGGLATVTGPRLTYTVGEDRDMEGWTLHSGWQITQWVHESYAQYNRAIEEIQKALPGCTVERDSEGPHPSRLTSIDWRPGR